MLLDSSGVVLATSSVRERAVEVLTRLGVVQYFDDMVFGTEIERGKPWPDIFLKAAEKAHAAPADCLVLEDSEAGIQAAHAAGIDVLCVPDMKMPAESYQQMTAAMLKSLDEVKGWLTAGMASGHGRIWNPPLRRRGRCSPSTRPLCPCRAYSAVSHPLTSSRLFNMAAVIC